MQNDTHRIILAGQMKTMTEHSPPVTASPASNFIA